MAFFTVVPAVAIGSPIQLSSVSIHLFLEGAGTFTDDVTVMKGFGSQNFTPFADVDHFNGDRFHSVLLKVVFTSPVEAFDEGVVAQLTVFDSDTGKVVLEQSISGLYLGPNGKTTVPFLIGDHECHSWRVEVKSGSNEIQKNLAFTCGE
jgi:hypothetical protein